MEHEQADGPIQATEAAPVAGAENERERTKSLLLTQMTQPIEALRLSSREPESVESEGLVSNDPDEIGLASADVGATTPAHASDSDFESAQVEAAPGDDLKKPKLFRGRWDHLNEQDRRVVELTTKRGLTLSEAYRAVFGVETVAATTTRGEVGNGQDSTALSALEASIGSQEERVSELKKRKAQAKGDLALYDEASEAYLEARDELRSLQERRTLAMRQREHESAVARQRAESLAQAALAEEFPDALTPGSDLHDACIEEAAYLRDINSPLIHDPQLHYKVARRMARVFGLRQATTPESAPVLAPKNAAMPPKRTVRPVPAGGMPAEPPMTTLERRVSEARSSGAMLDLMREFGTPFEALLKNRI